VLLHLFVKAGYRVAVAHCNFKLRGKESDDDELFVRNLVKKYKTEIFVKQCPAAEYANQHNLTIQEAARELRYGFFDTLLAEKKFDKIAVAHHADDDLETFFINLIRGSGLQGLKGMPVQRNNIIRPLMFATRDEIEQFARNNSITWREDSSNESDKYLRNNLRHHLLPQLKKIAPQADKVYQSLTFLKEDALVLETLLNNEKKKVFERENNRIKIPFDKLSDELPGDLWLFYLIRDFGFTRKDSANISESVLNRSTGKHFFSEKYELLIDREAVLIRKKSENKEQKFTIEENQTSISEPFSATISVLEKDKINLSALKNNRVAFLDYDKLSFPLVLRKWKKGDRFHPYGMRGAKLLSDFFTDLKLDRFEKENIWLLTSNGVIVWVTSFRIAEPFKISTTTKKVLKISLTESH
jgi:tRNA(Ile)-lysidine synthase